MAGLYERMGANDQALRLYLQALKTREKALGPDDPRVATILNNLAQLSQTMGDYDQALPLYQRALKIMEKVLGSKHPLTTATLMNLGDLCLARKDYAAAEAYFRRENSGAGLKIGLTELFLVQGKPEEALKLLRYLTPTWRDFPGYQVQYDTLLGLAWAGVGRLGTAALVLRQAVQGVEGLRRRTPGERTGFFHGGNIRPYRGMVRVLGEMALKSEDMYPVLKEYGPDASAAAFYFAEATKGRVLLESIAQAVQKTSHVAIPEEIRQREQNLHNQLAATEAQWEKALQGGEETLREANQRREKLRDELKILIQGLRQSYPAYAALHYPQPFPARDLPLRENEVLLEYALEDRVSDLFVVKKGGVQSLYPIAISKEALKDKVRSFMKPLLNDSMGGFSLNQGK